MARIAATGATTCQIADELCINVRTVDSHLSTIYRKLGVANRAGLAAMGAKGGSAFDFEERSGVDDKRLARRECLRRPPGRIEPPLRRYRRCTFRPAWMVLVGGEPGAGKSTLVAQALDQLGSDGPMVLIGVCVEELRAPFGAVTEAVSGYLADFSGRLSEVVGPDGGVLAALLPSLSDRLPSVAGDLDPRARLQLRADALRRTMVHAARERPTVVVLEDLHWADPTGIALLERLVTDPPDAPLVIVGTFRNTETSPGDPLFGLVSLAGNHTHLERIDLVGLDVTDAADLYHHFGGTTADIEELSRACESTAGNALYLSSLLRELAAGRPADELPSSLHDLIAHRTARLDQSDLEFVELAAVIGLDFDLDLLIDAAGRLGMVDPQVASDTLAHSLAQGVLTQSGDPAADFAFIHDVVRQVVLAKIAPRRLARLHAAVGRVLADRDDDDPRAWPTAIGHLLRSPYRDDLVRAAELAARFGGANVAVLSPETAAELLQSVLAVLPRGTAADRTRLDVLRVLIDVDNLRLANAEHRAAVIEAVDLAEQIGTPHDVAEILTHYRLLPATGTTDDEILALVDDAVAALPDDDPEAQRLSALLEGYAGYHRSIGGAGFTVAGDVEAALVRARLSGNRSAIGTTLYGLAAILLGSPDVERMQTVLAEFEPYRPEISGTVDANEGIRLAACAAIQTGDRAAFDRLHARLRRRGDKSKSGFLQSVAVMWDALVATLDGRIDDAAQRNDELLTMATADPNMLLGWFVQMVAIRSAQGRLDEVLDLVDTTRAEHSQLAPLHALDAWAHHQLGDVEGAWEIIEPIAAARFAAVGNDWTLAATLTWLTPTVILRGTEDHARILSNRLAPYSGQLVLAGSASDVLGAADRPLGLLAARLGQTEQALAHLAAAEALEERARAPLHAATTRLETARVLERTGDPADRKRADELVEAIEAEARAQGWVSLVRACSSPG